MRYFIMCQLKVVGFVIIHRKVESTAKYINVGRVLETLRFVFLVKLQSILMNILLYYGVPVPELSNYTHKWVFYTINARVRKGGNYLIFIVLILMQPDYMQLGYTSLCFKAYARFIFMQVGPSLYIVLGNQTAGELQMLFISDKNPKGNAHPPMCCRRPVLRCVLLTQQRVLGIYMYIYEIVYKQQRCQRLYM